MPPFAWYIVESKIIRFAQPANFFVRGAQKLMDADIPESAPLAPSYELTKKTHKGLPAHVIPFYQMMYKGRCRQCKNPARRSFPALCSIYVIHYCGSVNLTYARMAPDAIGTSFKLPIPLVWTL